MSRLFAFMLALWLVVAGFTSYQFVMFEIEYHHFMAEHGG